MSELPGIRIIDRLFRRPDPYTPFDFEKWRQQIKEHAPTHPQPPLPVAEPSPIPAPRKAYEAQPTPSARFVAPIKARRQKEMAR